MTHPPIKAPFELPQTEAAALVALIESAPAHIWLDLGENLEALDADAKFRDLSEVTWSEDNATGCGIKYVRADTLSHPAAQAGAVQAVGANVHEESATSIHATLYAPVLKEFCLEALREDEGQNWYIEVTDESGYHTYDGYWRDSDRKTCAEVLAEAADGSLLYDLAPLPADAISLAATQHSAAPGAEVADELLAFVEKIANGDVKDHMFSSLEDEACSLYHRAKALLALSRKS
ncbi:hypothetical protein J2W34_000088 [Variovorax boronicumulans]|uniref:hypothetical protein n=1 Tax=Variovorax boronicumulans TaxID=436515 RepID=UPI00277F5AD2|nr:hypothetical protein [Variovorax boronicumulans]MDQ0068314.1 hypothetical protein [Variovorax boronicumulans]